MFTGIVETVGTISRVQKTQSALQISIVSSLPIKEIKLGDSIMVHGICLTVSKSAKQELVFDVSHETVAQTALKYKKTGQAVHLERALPLGGRLGGHLVTGHVDGVGEVISKRKLGSCIDFQLQVQDELALYLVSKGSVAVDGVSLTVNQPRNNHFQITLVPKTLESTTLGSLEINDRVNLETDILGKYVRHFVQKNNGVGVSREFLIEHGFVDSK